MLAIFSTENILQKNHFTAPCYSNGAVLPSYGVCLSVRPSVCDVDGLWSHTLS